MDVVASFLVQAGSGAGASGSGDGLLVWGVVLLGLAAVLLAVEMIVPSGGLISLAAALSAVGGLVCLTFENTQLGLITTLAVVVASPFIAAFMLKVWPNTPIGRMLILRNEDTEQGGGRTARPARHVVDAEALPAVGATGSAKTALRPVGTCVINGHRVECLAEAGMIDAGATVRVVDVDGKEVRVREIAE